jgi:hypothetical protein
MANWLDKYNDGGPVQPNYNDASVSMSADFVGMGNDTTGRNYSPAWGGQFEDGGDLSFISDPKLRNMLEGYKPGFMDTVGDYRLPEGYAPPFKDSSSEISTSVGGEGGEPAYLIPTFKYGKRLNNPLGEFNMTGQHIGGPFKTVEDVERFGELRHQYVGDGKTLPSPIATSNMANGGKMCDSCQKAQDGKKVSGDEKRKRALAKAEEVFASSANPYTIPESVVKAGGNSNYVCIQGVCGILSDAGLIPKDYYTNTKFAEKAKDLGFGRAMADINLIKPGDVVQHMSDQNDAGVRFPSHAEMFKRVNPDTGEYEFYDYFDKYNGLGGIRTYSKDELEERFNRFKNRDNSGIQAQFFSLDPESLPQAAPQPFPYNLPQKEQEQYFNATHVANTKYYPGDAAQGPILDVPSYERSQTKHELTDLFNDKKLDEKLRKELKITDQDLQKAKPLIYGIMDQETDFGNPRSVGRNIKYGLKELLGSGQYSMGPAAVRYDEALSDEAKKAFGINSPKDLSKVKNAYIGALDVLSKGARYTDNNISGHPGLEDKDRMERALYWYNNPSNVVNSDAETFQAISRKANNLFPWQDKQEMMSKAYNSPLEMSVGSYPDKVLKQSKGLHQVIDFNDMNVLPEVRVVAPKDEVVQARGEFQMGGSLKDNAERALAVGSITTPFPLSYGLSLAGSAIDLYDAYNAKTPHDRNVQLTEAALGAIPYGRIVKGMKLGTDAYKAYKALKPIAAINSIIDVKDTVDPNLKYAMGGSMPGAVGFTYARTIDPAPSKGPYGKKTVASAQNGMEMKFYQNGLDFKPKSISRDGGWLSKYEEGGVIQDDMGQWAHPGEITKIDSNQITMQGVPYPVLGISDTGDTQMMYPNQEYQFIGNSVTEYPMMAQGGQLTKLDQLTNFTNYNTKQPGSWLDKYQ